MTMRDTTAGLSHTLQTSLHRRICAWCSIDLGELTHDSEQHSYGICVACAHQFFAALYAAEEQEIAPPMLRERAVGAD
jgi:hypothetical protein